MLARATSHSYRPSVCLAVAALAALVLICVAGCQTAGAPGTVPAPSTGMIGQPAQYGGWATMPQGAAYPASPSPPPMPGPATQWQGTAPAAPASSWSWSQPAAPAPQQTWAQYGNQMQAQAGQYPQNMTNQAQQYANQMQQQLSAQQQQLNAQMQNTANQYQQGAANQWQQVNTQAQQQVQQYTNQAQQALGGAQQQVTAQMPQYQPAYQPQTAPSTTWNPFSTSATTLPPARTTPVTTVPKY